MLRFLIVIGLYGAATAWGLPGFVGELRELHPEIGASCTSCHDRSGDKKPHAGSVTDDGRRFYKELLENSHSYGPDSWGPPGLDAPADLIVFGDSRTNLNVQQQIVTKICAEKARIVLHTGDMVESGSVTKQWQDAMRIQDCLLKAGNYHPSCGNHEGGNCVDNPLRKAMGNVEPYYRVAWNDFVFLALDSNDPTDEQLTWLKSLTPGKRYVPFFHHPPYPTMAGHSGDKNVIKTFVPEFKRLGVKLVLVGHNHGYDRAIVDGIQYVTTGGGGAPPYPCGNKKPYTQACYSGYNYLRCSLVESRLTCTARLLDGSDVDSFTIDFAGR